jgi:1-pyrroline-5-carboxylate dehydrogenase
VFQNIWKTIGQNIASYKSYPRIVGETGGKDFIRHRTAHAKAVPSVFRAAFESGPEMLGRLRVHLPSNP